MEGWNVERSRRLERSVGGRRRKWIGVLGVSRLTPSNQTSSLENSPSVVFFGNIDKMREGSPLATGFNPDHDH